MKRVFVLYLMAVVVFPYFYVKSIEWPIAQELNETTRKYTGKKFYSGRQILWAEAFEEIEKKPIIGGGYNYHTLAYNGRLISTHNLYIHFLLQGGIVLLLLYMRFLYLIWTKLIKHLDQKTVIFSAAFFIAAISLTIFGMLLFGNFLMPSLFIWLVIGIGMMKVNNEHIIAKAEI